jgi:hypothetical protein
MGDAVAVWAGADMGRIRPEGAQLPGNTYAPPLGTSPFVPGGIGSVDGGVLAEIPGAAGTPERSGPG